MVMPAQKDPTAAASVVRDHSMAQQHPLLFITPTLSEYTPVTAALAGPLAQGRVRVEMCGIGPARAAAFAEGLERSGPWSGLVLLGWAGGLWPDLAVGDMVLADAVLDVRGQRIGCVAIELAGARCGPLLTVGEVLRTPEAKRAARASGTLAVEMEAYPLAAWAAAHSVPFLHARVISDAVDDPLPDLGDALDAFGRVRPGRLMRLLLTRPRLVADLWPLMRSLRRLRPALGALAVAILAAWPPPAPA
jgi:nucleoside phosphorylase